MVLLARQLNDPFLDKSTSLLYALHAQNLELYKIQWHANQPPEFSDEILNNVAAFLA